MRVGGRCAVFQISSRHMKIPHRTHQSLTRTTHCSRPCPRLFDLSKPRRRNTQGPTVLPNHTSTLRTPACYGQAADRQPCNLALRLYNHDLTRMASGGMSWKSSQRFLQHCSHCRLMRSAASGFPL
ncbi:unnamed protein product [Pleuronectes platessa]|uniref:Uncharacterized protein n=1 Tax=Pleuronectes platessa TaxID=8262 RepID=A0A9N7YGW2_PLEPL|nr:unnamed protein product [Pleuronectes platessa]